MRISEARTFLASPHLMADQIKKMFEGLQIRLADQAADRLVFDIPTWRVDLDRECDLMEEVARLNGYDKIPYLLPRMSLEPTPEDAMVDFIEHARTDMASQNLRETISFPFWSDSDATLLRLPESHPFIPSVKLANPIADDAKWMQTTLTPALLKAVKSNRRHGVKGSRLFELGRGYYDFHSKPLQRSAVGVLKNLDRKGRHLSPRAREEKSRPTERHWIAGIIDQPWTPKSWDTVESPATFFHAKSVVSNFLKRFGVSEVLLQRFERDEVPYLHPGASAYIFAKGLVLGWIGEIHPEVALSYDFSPTESPIVFELDLESVLEASGKRAKISSESFKFPPSTRDLALLVDSSLSHTAMSEAISKFPQKRHLRDWRLFDIFQGSGIPEGKKSIAWSFSFQSAEKTLTDNDVESEFKNLTQYLTSTFKAEQR